jgi:hypothetical protein
VAVQAVAHMDPLLEVAGEGQGDERAAGRAGSP